MPNRRDFVGEMGGWIAPLQQYNGTIVGMDIVGYSKIKSLAGMVRARRNLFGAIKETTLFKLSIENSKQKNSEQKVGVAHFLGDELRIAFTGKVRPEEVLQFARDVFCNLKENKASPRIRAAVVSGSFRWNTLSRGGSAQYLYGETVQNNLTKYMSLPGIDNCIVSDTRFEGSRPVNLGGTECYQTESLDSRTTLLMESDQNNLSADGHYVLAIALAGYDTNQEQHTAFKKLVYAVSSAAQEEAKMSVGPAAVLVAFDSHGHNADAKVVKFLNELKEELIGYEEILPVVGVDYGFLNTSEEYEWLGPFFEGHPAVGATRIAVALSKEPSHAYDVAFSENYKNKEGEEILKRGILSPNKITIKHGINQMIYIHRKSLSSKNQTSTISAVNTMTLTKVPQKADHSQIKGDNAIDKWLVQFKRRWDSLSSEMQRELATITNPLDRLFAVAFLKRTWRLSEQGRLAAAKNKCLKENLRSRRSYLFKAAECAESNIRVVSKFEKSDFFNKQDYLEAAIARKSQLGALSIRRLMVGSRKRFSDKFRQLIEVSFRKHENAGVITIELSTAEYIEARKRAWSELIRLKVHGIEKTSDDSEGIRTILIVDEHFMSRSEANSTDGEIIIKELAIKLEVAVFDEIWNHFQQPSKR